MTEGRSTGMRTAVWSMAAGVALLAAGGRVAHAGGLEQPDIGTEAMGRGGAFTAKADDGTALNYNVAGLARQRGTRITIEGKLSISRYDFTRAGTYANVPGADYAGQPYPNVASKGLSTAPLIAVSTDFGYFDRWTFAVGLLTPSAAAANRDWPHKVNGDWPAPQRYDATNVDILVIYPTLAAAVRVTKWLDIGATLQMAYGHFDLQAAAYADLGNGVCMVKENPNCDANLHIKTSTFTSTAALGIMAHPIAGLQIGAQLRGPVHLDATGTLTATPPPAVPLVLEPGSPADPSKAKVGFALPWVARFGVRYAFLDQRKRERGDIEVDGVYEAWNNVEGNGDKLHVNALSVYENINAVLVHHYKDAGSIRVGGAYNFWFSNATMLALRLGVFYDSSATSAAWTRIDFDTLSKVGYTIGLGYKIRGVTINAAYNYVSSPTRVVADGKQHANNGFTGKQYGPDGYEPVFNNGTYRAHTQNLMLGLGFDIDRIMRNRRVLAYE